ncbi:MAG TPA: ATP-binding protein [Bacteroidales bacterium]|nr:ATP-binding protein [Bacteroidales bacterium]
MKSHHITDLIKQGENQSLDFKFEISDSRKIARTLVAFSNTDGGTLLIGVKDNGVIAGIRSEEEKYMVETAALMYTRPMVRYATKEWQVEGKTVLEVVIAKGDERPYFALEPSGRWMAYIRVKDQNLLANRVLLKVWEKAPEEDGVVIHYTEKERLFLDYLDRNGTVTLAELCEVAGISRHKAEGLLVDFIRMKIIEMVFTEKEVYYRFRETVQ